jgi:external thioesterase TEII
MKPQLFLVHFAGGNCYSFQFMNLLLNKFDIIPLELPGRGKRMQEGLIKDFDLAAQDIYNQILGKLVPFGNFLIYGHSMGAYLTLRVTGMLEKINKFPMHIIVSGNPGPGLREDKRYYLLEKDKFIEALKEMGGLPMEIIENKELFDFFEPIIRADFEIVEKVPLDSEKPVNVPIYAMMGSEEEKAKDISNWSNFTKAGFNFEVLKGDHFFIHKHSERIASIINECYETVELLK